MEKQSSSRAQSRDPVAKPLRQLRRDRSVRAGLAFSLGITRFSFRVLFYAHFEFLPRNSPETHSIARMQQRWRLRLRIKQTQRRAADNIPTTQRFKLINASFIIRDGDGTSMPQHPRIFQT